MDRLLILILLASLSISCLSLNQESLKSSPIKPPTDKTESPVNSSATQTLPPLKSEVERSELWLEVHDVSPGWEYWRLQQLLEVIEKHKKAISKTVLFVIPNHANVTPLYSHPEYIEKLKILEQDGYAMGMHGYTHDVETPEFNNSKESTERMIKLGFEVFEKSDMSSPKHFAPPAWIISNDSKDLLESVFDYVYYGSKVKTPEGIKEYLAHEYTWNATKQDRALDKAQSDYLDSEKVFRLVVHIGAVNTPENLEFISEFLKWVENYNDRA